MRIMHTADWHAGKKLGRVDRKAEFEQVFDELVAIAKDQKPDVVIVAGDLFDRSIPPLDSLALVIDALIRLADAGGRVIALPGNHDSPQLFETLARLLEPAGVTLVPRINRPEAGGVLTLPSRDGTHEGSFAMFPFLLEAQTVDFMRDTRDWFTSYDNRIRLLCKAYCQSFDPSRIGVLVGHYFVEGAEVGGGERKIHMGQQYASTAQSIPPGAAYVALGHIHRPQAIAGAAVPARYAGSILPLDFSERTHNKEVVIVDAVHGQPAKVKSIQLSSGRKLIRVQGPLEVLRTRVAELGDAYLDVRVETDGPRFGLAEEVRATFPNAVIVQGIYDRIDARDRVFSTESDKTLAELYGDYHTAAHGADAPDELLATMRELEEAVTAASS